MDDSKNTMTITFGSHLTIDGYGGDSIKLNDMSLIYRCLNELPGLLGLKKLGEPLVMEAPPVSDKDSGGYSGFVMINTSHISCHTFPKRHFVSIDVYTCHDSLGREFIEKYFRDAFSLQDLEVNYLKRGTRFPAQDIC